MNYPSLLLATFAAFGASAAYYIALAKQRAAVSQAARESGRPKPGILLLELARTGLLAAVLSYLLGRLDVSGIGDAARLSLLLWVAFPCTLLTGSAIYEKVPWKLATIHAGDWAIKLLIMTAILR